jgi:hypothetical protein
VYLIFHKELFSWHFFDGNFPQAIYNAVTWPVELKINQKTSINIKAKRKFNRLYFTVLRSHANPIFANAPH